MTIRLVCARLFVTGLSFACLLALQACSNPIVVPQTGTTMQDLGSNGSGGGSDGGTGGGSTTGAKTWEPAGFAAGGLFTAVAVDRMQPMTVYAAADVSGVYRSDDGGDTWVAKNAGLTSHAIADLLIDPSNHERIWATTALGLFRSDDRAESWTLVNADAAAYVLTGFRSVAVSGDGQTVLATTHTVEGGEVFQNDYRSATLTGGLLRSTNGGVDWSSVSGFPATYAPGTRFPIVQFDPFHEGVAFLAVSGVGILRSADGGLTWADFSTGLPGDRSDIGWRSMSFSATSVFAAATQLTPVEAGPPLVFTSNATTPGWASIAGNLPPADSLSVQKTAAIVRVSPENENHINLAYAGFPSLFFQTDDGGATWQGTSVETVGAYAFDTEAAPFHNTRNPFEDFIDLAIDPSDPSRMFATSWVGIWRSTDGGTTWQETVRGTQNTVCTDILFTGSEFYATHWDMVLQSSTDPTQSWREALPVAGSPGDLLHGWSVGIAGNGTLFTGVSTESGPPRVYRLREGGTVWEDRSPPFATSGDALIDSQTEVTIAVDPADAQTVYAVNRAASEGIYRSTDGGGSWSKLPAQPASGNSTELAQFESLAVDPDDGQRLYAGTFWDGLWYSADGGSSWSLATANGGSTEGALIGDIIALPGRVVWAAAQDGVYKSTDGGRTYTRSLGAEVSLAEFEYFVALTVNPADPNELFAASAQIHPVYSLNGSVWHTTNGGANWTNITDDLTHKRVNTLEYAQGYLYAGIEGANVFRRAIQ